MKNIYLALPGPTPVCSEALLAMATPMFNHRGPRFEKLYREVLANCHELFQTANDLFILTASGTGAMEAAIANTLSPGDKVLAVVNGAFGQRFADIARCYGGEVDVLEGEWGQGIDLEQFEKKLKQGGHKIILVVHCETSTGVLNQLEQVAELRDRHVPEALLLVDAISSLGAAELPVDKWGLDVVVTGSQKVLAAPPGLAMISFSERAWSAYKHSTTPKYYWDLAEYKAFLEKGQPPFTPAISQFLALKEASGRFVAEGLKNSIKRHRQLTLMTRAGVRALGLQLVCPDEVAATTVTAIYPPEGIDVARLRNLLREKYGLIVAGGQGKLATTTFRIGHLGIADQQTIIAGLYCLEKGLLELGCQVEPGASVKAAVSVTV